MIWYLLIGAFIVVGYQLHIIYDAEHDINKTLKTFSECFSKSNDGFRPLYLTVTVLSIIGWPFTLAFLIDMEMKGHKKRKELEAHRKNRV